MIHKYVFFEWRSIRQVKINDDDITMTTYNDITMSNNVAKDIYCDVPMSNDFLCTHIMALQSITTFP